jgi:hypothetical protein
MKAQSMTSTSHIKNHDSLAHEKINRVMGIKEWGLIIVLSIIWEGSFFFVGVAVKEVTPLTIVLCRVTLKYRNRQPYRHR